MHKRRSKRARRRRPEELAAEPQVASPMARNERHGPLYNAGPVHELLPRLQSNSATGHHNSQLAGRADSAPTEQEQAISPLNGSATESQRQPGLRPTPRPAQELLPTLEGRGEPEHAVAFNQRGPLRLQGRTDATFDGGQFHTENVTVRQGRGCDDCGDCIRAAGTLVATYSVSTTVTLPSVSDFPGLTHCQQLRVQQAIQNVLSPHEQQHVGAFRRYNGTTRRAFDLTICRNRFDSAIQSMFESEERARRQVAQAASDALDHPPFHFDVDIDCQEPQQPRRRTTGVAELPPAEEQPV
ncbi:MAG: hypothetical protein WCD37_02875 [Chloroflexia bacterium]